MQTRARAALQPDDSDELGDGEQAEDAGNGLLSLLDAASSMGDKRVRAAIEEQQQNHEALSSGAEPSHQEYPPRKRVRSNAEDPATQQDAQTLAASTTTGQSSSYFPPYFASSAWNIRPPALQTSIPGWNFAAEGYMRSQMPAAFVYPQAQVSHADRLYLPPPHTTGIFSYNSQPLSVQQGSRQYMPYARPVGMQYGALYTLPPPYTGPSQLREPMPSTTTPPLLPVDPSAYGLITPGPSPSPDPSIIVDAAESEPDLANETERPEFVRSMTSSPLPSPPLSFGWKRKGQVRSDAPTDKRPFPCSKCDLRFVRLEHAKRHIAHCGKELTVTKSVACPHCDAKFTRVDNMQVHARTKHKIVLKTKPKNLILPGSLAVGGVPTVL